MASLHVHRNYSSLAAQRSGRNMRMDDDAFALRRANNTCKAFMIEAAARMAALEVGEWSMDIGCGRGGDLKKFEAAGMWHMWLVDCVDEVLSDLGERVKAMRASSTLPPAFACRIMRVDMGGWTARMSLLQSTRHRFGVITSHFAFHYMCARREDVAHFLHVCSCLLRPGGVLSLVYARWDDVFEAGGVWRAGGLATAAMEAGGEQHYQRVRVKLEGAVDDVPEYVVPLGDVLEAADALGLRLERHETLAELWHGGVASWGAVERMNRTWGGEEVKGRVTEEGLRVMGRYVWLVWRKA